MRALNHPNIVRMLADLKGSDEQYFIVMEKVEGGELFDRIVELEAYSEEQARATAVVLLDALRYLHGQGIAHRGSAAAAACRIRPPPCVFVAPLRSLRSRGGSASHVCVTKPYVRALLALSRRRRFKTRKLAPQVQENGLRYQNSRLRVRHAGGQKRARRAALCHLPLLPAQPKHHHRPFTPFRSRARRA